MIRLIFSRFMEQITVIVVSNGGLIWLVGKLKELFLMRIPDVLCQCCSNVASCQWIVHIWGLYLWVRLVLVYHTYIYTHTYIYNIYLYTYITVAKSAIWEYTYIVISTHLWLWIGGVLAGLHCELLNLCNICLTNQWLLKWMAHAHIRLGRVYGNCVWQTFSYYNDW